MRGATFYCLNHGVPHMNGFTMGRALDLNCRPHNKMATSLFSFFFSSLFLEFAVFICLCLEKSLNITYCPSTIHRETECGCDHCASWSGGTHIPNDRVLQTDG